MAALTKKMYLVHPTGYWQSLDVPVDSDNNSSLSLGSKLGKVKAGVLRACPHPDAFLDLVSMAWSSTAPTFALCPDNADGDDEDETEAGDIDGPERPNDVLFDDNTAQRLTREELETLKQSAPSANAILERLVQGSDSFAKKTAHAQTKYLKRKHAKYARFVQAKPVVTPSLALRLLLSQGKQRNVGYLREDSFAQLSYLMQCSLPQSGQVLLFDECSGGLLAAQALHYLGGGGAEPADTAVVCTTDKQQPNHGFLDALLDDGPAWRGTGRLGSLPIDILLSNEFPAARADSTAPYLERWARNERCHRQSWQRRFDVLVVALAEDFERLPSLIAKLSVLLKASGRLIAYVPGHCHAIQTTFLDLLRGSLAVEETKEGGRPFVDAHVWTTWTRSYQTDAGRLHPQMTMTAAPSGLVMSAFKVV